MRSIKVFLGFFVTLLIIISITWGVGTAQADEVVDGLDLLSSTSSEWIFTGQQSISSIGANDPKLLKDSLGNLYIIFEDKSLDNKVFVKKLDGQIWNNYGNIDGEVCDMIGAEMSSDDQIYMACRGDVYGSVFVKKLNSSLGNWDSVGPSVVGTSSDVHFALDKNNVPYVYHRGALLKIFRYTNDAWSELEHNFTADNLKLVFDSNNNLFLFFVAGNSIYVYSYQNSLWYDLGISSDSLLFYDFDFNLSPDNEPIVAYRSENHNAVKKYSNGSWTSLGDFSSFGGFFTPKIFFYGNTPYLSYADIADERRLMIVYYNGSSWDYVSTHPLSNGAGYNVSSVIKDSLVYVAYTDEASASNVFIKKMIVEPEIYYTGQLIESYKNDGSVTGDFKANIALGQFSNPGGTLVEGVHFSINNKPLGLGAVTMNVDQSGDVATILLAAKSTLHNAEHSISNLSIIFNDSAFSNGLLSADINNSSYIQGSILFIDEPYVNSAEISSPGKFYSGGLVNAGYSNKEGGVKVIKDGDDIVMAHIHDYDYEGIEFSERRIGVKIYNGSSWQESGSFRHLLDGADNILLATDSRGDKYLAYNYSVDSMLLPDGNPQGEPFVPVGGTAEAGNLIIYHFNENAWETIFPTFGSNPWSVSGGMTCSIKKTAYKDDFLFFLCSDGATYKYNVDTRVWHDLGSLSAFGSDVKSFDADINGSLYALIYKAGSTKANGSYTLLTNDIISGEWAMASSLSFGKTAIKDGKVIIDGNNNFYLIYKPNNVDTTYFKRLVGGAWVDINNTPIIIFDGLIRFDAKFLNNDLYFTYSNINNNNKARMVKINTDSGLVEDIGLGYFSNTGANDIALFIDNNNPVAFYYNESEDIKAHKFYANAGVTEVVAVTDDANNVTLSWEVEEPQEAVDKFVVRYREVEDFTSNNGGDWISTYDVDANNNQLVIEDVGSGLYKTEVIAVNQIDVNSKPAEAFFVINTLISPDGIGNLSNVGIITPTRGTATNTESIRFNQRTKISIPAGPSVTIPSGVTMTASSTFQVIDLVATEANVSNLTAINPVGALKFGLPNLGLTLSSPITITIPTTGVSNGTTLSVYMKSPGADWTSLTTCVVTGSTCSFETSHLSEFAAGLAPSSGSSNPIIISECTEVVFTDFDNSCSDGYKYRGIVSKSPANCSLTAKQINDSKMACGAAATEAEKTTDKVVVAENQLAKQARDLFLTQERKAQAKISSSLAKRLAGRILLQVEEKGEAWYVNPLDNRKHYLGRPDDAFSLMRTLGLGISNKDFDSYKNQVAPQRLSGRILLKVEDKGRAYYVDPLTLKMHYLGRPADAFNLMRQLGLGISNENVRKINLAD